ncbi:MAG: hypothetical protein JXA33_12955 [Anaerolineae bacterium]|nr:hypothetical protein [Anaerolineae bacterium]
MNSHSWESADFLFEQALVPYTKAKPSVSVWERIMLRLHPVPGSSLRRVFSWFPAMTSPFFIMTSPSVLPRYTQCYFVNFGRCYASPFVGAVISLMWDKKLIS